MIKKQVSMITAALLITMFGTTKPVFADNVLEFLNSTEQNYKAQRYSRALADLEWARKEIVSLQLAEMKGFLPDEIKGMQGRDDDSGAMMGFHTVSKTYRDQDAGHSISIEIMKGATGDAGTGLGAIFGMAMAMGGMDPSKPAKTIVQKGYRGTFTMDTNSDEGTLIFNLDGGSRVTITTRGYVDEGMAKEVAEKLDLVSIENTLR
ncbi:hypothetical protein [Desulfobulbus alkaliphilus]|uniref:hypothetical protein n=1 Tax=Desulfobulbus alkaliphilus TaxID=869814 RepID=UPI001964338C|nr:hypothetical protein [Desulfobulbus alkaliphilus]MBM9535676.1 hypothetical protein [Desulfobulbus alkaliphilus]